MTVESFKAWKARFDKEMAQKKAREEDERLKSLTPKEREEYKKLASRLSGLHQIATYVYILVYLDLCLFRETTVRKKSQLGRRISCRRGICIC